MSSLKQIEANRLNAQKSTGPRSVVGKAAIRMNALKSGIDAQSTIIRGENPADLEALTNEYLAAHSPVTPQERFHVDTLIRCDWQMRRLTRADTQLWEYQFGELYHLPKDTPLGRIYMCTDTIFAPLQRHIKSLERSYKDASRELTLLQSASEADDRFASSADANPRNPEVPPRPESAPTPDPDPPPQPTASEPTSPQIGFVPSGTPTPDSDPIAASQNRQQHEAVVRPMAPPAGTHNSEPLSTPQLQATKPLTGANLTNRMKPITDISV